MCVFKLFPMSSSALSQNGVSCPSYKASGENQEYLYRPWQSSERLKGIQTKQQVQQFGIVSGIQVRMIDLADLLNGWVGGYSFSIHVAPIPMFGSCV